MYSLNREYTSLLTAPSAVPTSELSEPHSEDEYGPDNFGPDKRGHKGRERRCIATGEAADTAAMIRFVLSPTGDVTPDIMGKLPGRGVWVTASKEHMAKAVKTGGFARGFKTKVKAGDEVIALTQELLERRLLGLLTMARKSGHIAIGYDQVKAAAGSGKIAWRIEAREGASDGRGKIRTLSKAVAYELEIAQPKVMGCFSGAQLAEALGRESVIHIALPQGKLAKSFTADAARYAGFTDLIPTEWDDYKHEIKTAASGSEMKASGERP